MLNESEKNQVSPWYQLNTEGGIHSLKLTGSYTLGALNNEIKKLGTRLEYFANKPNVQWDLTGIETLDHVG
ncbi:MAG TPA: ABC transporter permease, partial [Nitrosomonas sp.]|nr:ABC transporter permease [Nitrosomonas sp.]